MADPTTPAPTTGTTLENSPSTPARRPTLQTAPSSSSFANFRRRWTSIVGDDVPEQAEESPDVREARRRRFSEGREGNLTELAIPDPVDRSITRRDSLEARLHRVRSGSNEGRGFSALTRSPTLFRRPSRVSETAVIEDDEEEEGENGGRELQERSSPIQARRRRRPTQSSQREDQLSELATPEPVSRSYRRVDSLEHRMSLSPTVSRDQKPRSSKSFRSKSSGAEEPTALTELVAPPAVQRSPSHADETQYTNEDEKEPIDEEPLEGPWTRFATELYTHSWLIFFSILGTLARLGVEALARYPNVPFTSTVLWANVFGSLFLGFLTEDRRIFREEWGVFDSNRNSFNPADEETASVRSRAKRNHTRVKKTIPLFIGLATGFCGSFSSFSSFMRDSFLALTNDLPAPSPGYPVASPPDHPLHPRNGGYSFMAVVGMLISQPALSISGYHVGAHIALAVDPIIPTLPFRFIRRILDPLAVLLAFGCWLGAVLLTIFPANHYRWRASATLALVFSPVGCLFRFYASKYLNARLPWFPLGTFSVNMFGTAVLGMCWDLQHAPSIVGADPNPHSLSYAGCAVLQGVIDGFCGATTTVSTWVAELSALRRGNGYVYGVVSMGLGLTLLVCTMGAMGWTVGFGRSVCAI